MNTEPTITAKIVADSVYYTRITTFEIEYPRFILAELNTHRLFSRNSASSRAIPTKTMLEHIRNNPAMPVYWGQNKAGMQAENELHEAEAEDAKFMWLEAMYSATSFVESMQDINLHKQITNRIVEPWMTMKTVLTGTEFANFFWLRDHKDAQPEIAELARKMREAYDASEPIELTPGEWHLPYMRTCRTENGLKYINSSGEELSLEQARIISASCCAQVSYRKNDDSYEKALKIYKQLVESEPCHASPVEHQATPMNLSSTIAVEPETWELGTTHLSRNGDLWSGNFRHWIQFRKLIPNEAKW